LQKDFANSTQSSDSTNDEEEEITNKTFYPVDKILLGITRWPEGYMSNPDIMGGSENRLRN